MFKKLRSVILGSCITMMAGFVVVNATTINCDYCGEKFNNLFTVEDLTCDICYGWQEYHEALKDGTNKMYNKEFGDTKPN